MNTDLPLADAPLAREGIITDWREPPPSNETRVLQWRLRSNCAGLGNTYFDKPREEAA